MSRVIGQNPLGAAALLLATVVVLLAGVWIIGDDGPDATISPIMVAEANVPELDNIEADDKFIVQAKSYMDKREWDKAQSLLRLAIEKDPSNGAALELLATAAGAGGEELDDGVRTVRLSATLQQLGRPALFGATAEWVARNVHRFDVVHAHALSSSALGSSSSSSRGLSSTVCAVSAAAIIIAQASSFCWPLETSFRARLVS